MKAPAKKLLTDVITLVSLLLMLGGFLTLQGTGTTKYVRTFSEPPTKTHEPLVESAPVHLSIPSINVSTSFVELGLDAKSEIEIPESFTDVGWYTHGPTPGELGPAVILGHVDSYEGPAVFFSLGQVKKGDEVRITREDGSVAIFAIDRLERYPQNQFPTSLVYGDLDYAGLRLITCSGTYDHATLRYDQNLIVYASLIGVE